MISFASLAIIISFALANLLVAVFSLTKPSLAKRILNAFAATFQLHFLEMAVRIIIGAAMIFYAGNMKFPVFFHIFGIILIVTSIIMLFVPWRYHQRFARFVLRPLIQNVWVFGILSLPLGLFVLYSLI